jgi:hypothetical protein
MTATYVALAVFLVAAIGALIAGYFPMDFPGPPRTASGRLHALGGALTFPSWVLGTLFFSLSVGRHHSWGKRACSSSVPSTPLETGLVEFFPAERNPVSGK